MSKFAIRAIQDARFSSTEAVVAALPATHQYGKSCQTPAELEARAEHPSAQSNQSVVHRGLLTDGSGRWRAIAGGIGISIQRLAL